MNPIRAVVAALAASLAGLSAASDPDRYADTLAGPADGPQFRRDVLGQSCCALLVLAIWRLLGCTHELLRAAYVDGRAMGNVETIARAFGAWRKPNEDDGPGVGDAVRVVDERGDQHVFTVIAFGEAADGRWRLTSIDGGQGEHGAGVLQRTRTWHIDEHGALIDEVDAIPGDPRAPFARRRVEGYVDCTALGLVVEAAAA